jgi:hypothetical protein
LAISALMAKTNTAAALDRAKVALKENRG